MINITIKNKCYLPITTCIEGVTFLIPPKGKNIKINVSSINEHLKQLETENKIAIILNEEINKGV